MNIVSIDIGLFHLGMVRCQTLEDYTYKKVDFCKLINLKKLVEECELEDCKFEHELCIADYMRHFFSVYGDVLDGADVILVERQPPMGFISIQELLRYQYRDKVVVISPNAVHSYFGIGGRDYEGRKDFTVQYSQKYLEEFESFHGNRKHDLGDSFVMLRYYLLVEGDKYRKRILKNKDLENYNEIIIKLDSFRFKDQDF